MECETAFCLGELADDVLAGAELRQVEAYSAEDVIDLYIGRV